MDLNNDLNVDGSITASGRLGGGFRRRMKGTRSCSGVMGRSHPMSSLMWVVERSGKQ